MPDLHAFGGLGDRLLPPSLDSLRETARRRDQRHSVAAVLAAAVAVVVVVVGIALLADSDGERTAPPPADSPGPSVTTRPLTYTDDYVDDFRRGQPPRWLIRSIQYGEQTLRPGVDVMHMDLTDDGLALVAKDGGIYFADGSSVEKIGDAIIEDGMSWSADGLTTSTAGSQLAWFAPTRPHRSLVVYDTRERQVLAEVPTPGCVEYACQLKALVGDRVYWSESPDPTSTSSQPLPSHPLMALDVSSGRVLQTDAEELWQDLRANPRAFVAGDSFAKGQVMSNEINYQAVYFEPHGSKLELRRVVREKANGDEIYGLGGYDTTGRRLNLGLPDGYTPAPTEYSLFQWLDDDRFAVMPGATFSKGLENVPGYGDILVCDIAEERCTLAAPGPTNDRFRLVPHLNVPN